METGWEGFRMVCGKKIAGCALLRKNQIVAVGKTTEEVIDQYVEGVQKRLSFPGFTAVNCCQLIWSGTLQFALVSEDLYATLQERFLQGKQVSYRILEQGSTYCGIGTIKEFQELRGD